MLVSNTISQQPKSKTQTENHHHYENGGKPISHCNPHIPKSTPQTLQLQENPQPQNPNPIKNPSLQPHQIEKLKSRDKTQNQSNPNTKDSKI